MRFLRNLWRAIKGWPKCADCGARVRRLCGFTGACRACAFDRVGRMADAAVEAYKQAFEAYLRAGEGKQ